MSTLGELAELVGAEPPADVAVAIRGVCDDSRSVVPGNLYLALPGRHVHGLEFEAEAAARGAVAVMSDRASRLLPTIVVDDPRRWAGPVSSHIHCHPSTGFDVYGVTGTNGKTSTTYLLASTLAALGERVGMMTGITICGPSGISPAARTTPEAAVLQRTLAEFRDDGVTAAAMEVSSHGVVQGRVDATRFAAMVFTNLGRDHLDFHGSMENYYAAKASLFTADRTNIGVVGVDDAYGRRLSATVDVPHWTFSTVDHSADVFGDHIVCDASGTSFVARTPLGSYPIALPLLGRHQVCNALAALTPLVATGRNLDTAIAGIEAVTCVPGRLERVRAGQSFMALVDYVHNMSGQRQLLPYLRSLTTGQLIIVLGATGDRDPGKRFPLGTTAATFADVVIVTDESPFSEDAATIRNAVAAGAAAARHAEVIVEPDRRRAFTVAAALAQPADVLVAVGRGCDQYQTYGAATRPFDDRRELWKVLYDNATAPATRRLRSHR